MEIEYNFLNYNIKIVKSHYIFEIFYNFFLSEIFSSHYFLP